MPGRDVGVWIGITLVLAGAFARAVCRAEPFPWWESDPYAFGPPIVGLTPVWALAVNAVVIGGGALVVVCGRRGLGGVGAWSAAVGLGVIGYHAAIDVETVSPGADLAAGVCGVLAGWVACATPGVRRVVVGVALGFGVMLAVVGAHQTFVEHPATLGSFEETKGAFYAARGWEPGGPEALMYEERLSHANPTGAFGLTNVFATFAGAAVVGLAACVFAPGWSVWGRLVTGAGAGVSGWALVATGSKGGIGAALLAAGVLLAVWRIRADWVGRAVVLAAVGVVLVVGVRGAIGGGLGEKSLLFRAQYQAGAAAVIAESPVVGVGAGNFQDAYSRLKPAGAVEDVTSTHSVWLDWVAMLGLGGAALVFVSGLGWWSLGGAWGGRVEGDGVGARARARLACGVVAFAVLCAVFSTKDALSLGQALAVLGGGVGWVVVGGWIAGSSGVVRGAGVGAGAVAMVHAQLDVAGMWAVSAPAWGVLVGCGIGCWRGSAIGGRGRDSLVAGGAMAALLVLMGWRGLSIARWESSLHGAAAWASRVNMARAELGVARGPIDLGGLAERAGGWLGARVPAEERAVSDALDGVVWATQEEAAAGLRAALVARPSHFGTRRALGRVLVTISARDGARSPESAVRALDEAVALAEGGLVASGGDPAAWVWLGRALERRGSLAETMGEDGSGWLRRAVEVWEEGDALTPHDPGSAARIAEMLSRMGLSGEARRWGERAIERDDRMVLDPRRGLGRDRRAAMERLSEG